MTRIEKLECLDRFRYQLQINLANWKKKLLDGGMILPGRNAIYPSSDHDEYLDFWTSNWVECGLRVP